MERWRLSFTSRNRRRALLNAKSAQAECLCYPEGRGKPAHPFSRKARQGWAPSRDSIGLQMAAHRGWPWVGPWVAGRGLRVGIYSNGSACVPLTARIAYSNVEDSGP